MRISNQLNNTIAMSAGRQQITLGNGVDSVMSKLVYNVKRIKVVTESASRICSGAQGND